MSDLALWEIGLILAAAFATSIFHTISGFAGGVVLSIFVAPIVGVAAVVPLLSIGLIIGASVRLWAFRRYLDLPVFLTIVLPALPGIFLSAYVYALLPPHALAVLLGLFLIATVLLRRPMGKRGRKVGAAGLGLLGGIWGLLSGATIGAGMMLPPFLIARGIVKERLAAMFAALGFSLNLARSIVFGITTTIDWRTVIIGVAIGLCTIPGTYTGLRILRRTRVQIHTMFVEGLVLVAGFAFIASGFGLT